MNELTPEAQQAIDEAVRIVREDRFEAHARTVLGRHGGQPAGDPPTPPVPPADPPTGGPPAPPVKDPTTEPPKPTGRPRGYWGDIFTEETPKAS